jgi:hypothetical protein
MTTITTTLARIDDGQSLSNAVDCANNFVVGIIMPPAWTTARVSTLLSIDNVNFYDLFSFDMDSTSATEFVFNVTPGTMISINPNTMLPARYVKLRSGTRSKPVPQAAAREFTVIMVNQVTT